MVWAVSIDFFRCGASSMELRREKRMNRFALIIGLENYAEAMGRVIFAENDANAFCDCLLELGYDPRDVTCLISSQATQAKIESEIRRLARLSQEDDEILLFFSGHGLAIKNLCYITCYDTAKADLPNTCISLKWILNLFNTASSTRKLLFLDTSHSGLRIDEATSGITGAMDEGELTAFFGDNECAVGFVSCQSHELSYPGPNIRHGIWTYHLLQALQGVAPSAVNSDKYITSASLQHYLVSETPKTLRIENPNRVTQTPICFGDISQEFVLFDVSALIERRVTDRKEKLVGVKSVDLLGAKGGHVKELSGFKKGLHQVPETVNDYTASFVAGIAAQDVEFEATKLYEQIKSNFKYKRRDIKLEIDGASAFVATKDFDLSITYSQDTEDPGAYSIEYLINNVRDAAALNDEGLQNILDRHFDEVRFSLKGEIDLEELIDAIESEDDGEILIDYPPDCSRLRITLDGCRWSIKLSQNGISIINHRLEAPKTMLSFFNEGQSLISKRTELRHLLK